MHPLDALATEDDTIDPRAFQKLFDTWFTTIRAMTPEQCAEYDRVRFECLNELLGRPGTRENGHG